MYFTPSEISLVKSTFKYAENLVERYFGLEPGIFKIYKYEVETLKNLKDHEIDERAFAHLCRYYYQKDKKGETFGDFYFFRICLQDNRICDAVERGKSFIRLSALLLYIATHELVHVVRFSCSTSDFDATLEEKIKEEERVHLITRNILQPVSDSNLALVLDCFSDRYEIGDLFI